MKLCIAKLCIARIYSKICVKGTLSNRPKIVFQDQLSLNAGQKFCRMLQGEHSAILLTFIKLPFVIKIFVLSIFEWLFYCTQFAKTKTIFQNWIQYYLESILACDPTIYTMDHSKFVTYMSVAKALTGLGIEFEYHCPTVVIALQRERCFWAITSNLKC